MGIVIQKLEYSSAFVVICIMSIMSDANAILCPSSENTVTDICSTSDQIRNIAHLNVSKRGLSCRCKLSLKKQNNSILTDFRQVNGPNDRGSKCPTRIVFAIDTKPHWNLTCSSDENEKMELPIFTNQSIFITTEIENIQAQGNSDFCIELKFQQMQTFRLECGNVTLSYTPASSANQVLTSTVLENKKDTRSSSMYQAVGGSIGAAMLVLLFVVVIFLYRRKRIKNYAIQTKRTQAHETQIYEDDELRYNVLYQSATSNSNESSTVYEDTYDDSISTKVEQSKTSVSKVQKPMIAQKPDLKVPGISGCEYAVVNKTGSRKVSVDISSSVSNDTSSEC